MKKLLLLCAMATTANLSAQPTLSSMDVPAAGDIITISGRDSFFAHPGPSGANITWDFSWVTANQTATTNYVAASATPYNASFPTSTIASYEDTSSYTYWTKSSSVWQSDGSGSSSGDLVYTDPLILLTFPFTYNSTYSDNFVGAGTIIGIPITQSGTVSLVADGYGTLITPEGTFTGVLRCKRKVTALMTIFGFSTADTADIYEWYKPGYKAPLMSVNHQRVWDLANNTMDSSTSISYLQATPNNIEAYSVSSALSIVPNPTSEVISLPELKKEMYFTIADATGRTLHAGRYLPGKSISVAALPEGLYFLAVSDGQQKFHSKFQVKR
jgi:hypothetical protein